MFRPDPDPTKKPGSGLPTLVFTVRKLIYYISFVSIMSNYIVVSCITAMILMSDGNPENIAHA